MSEAYAYRYALHLVLGKPEWKLVELEGQGELEEQEGQAGQAEQEEQEYE
jgi:hypothetical protein